MKKATEFYAYVTVCHPERSDAAEQQAKSNFCGMEYPSRSRIRNRAKAQATIPGTVPCDVPEGHVTAGLSPVTCPKGMLLRDCPPCCGAAGSLNGL